MIRLRPFRFLITSLCFFFHVVLESVASVTDKARRPGYLLFRVDALGGLGSVEFSAWR